MLTIQTGVWTSNKAAANWSPPLLFLDVRGCLCAIIYFFIYLSCTYSFRFLLQGARLLCNCLKRPRAIVLPSFWNSLKFIFGHGLLFQSSPTRPLPMSQHNVKKGKRNRSHRFLFPVICVILFPFSVDWEGWAEHAQYPRWHHCFGCRE